MKAQLLRYFFISAIFVGFLTINTGASAATIDWIGHTANWNTPGNWSSNTVPLSNDIVRFGVASAIITQPVVSSASAAVGSVILGNLSGVVTITVNSGFILTVNGNITSQSDNLSFNNYVHLLTGAGTVNANSIVVIANTANAGHSYNATINSSVAHLNIISIKLTSTVINAFINNARFTIKNGVVNASGIIHTTNTAGSTSSVVVSKGTLQLSNATPLSGLSAIGTNVITFKNLGATIEYSGAAQTVYTDAAITGLPAGVSYQNIKFSGTGIKTVGTGNLNIAGDFTNALANDAANYVALNTPAVNFNGTIAQNLNGGVGTGTVLYTVNFSGASTKTMASGSFFVASSGILTMGAGSVLAAGGLLTLNSDALHSATISAIPVGASISGNVNVQRYITGNNDNTYRGYRMLSSPVYLATVGGNKVYSLNYVKSSCYVTGTSATAGGFDNSGGGNPTLYLFRENIASSNASFTSGNNRGVNNITTSPVYSLDGDGGGFSVPAGNGFLLFFRGDRNVASFAAETGTPYAPTNTTLTATGTLNQGQVVVKDWYTPASAKLGFTNTPGNLAVQGFNLVGNPYASSINWDTFSTTVATAGIYGPNLGSSVYVLDPASKNYNVYQAGNGGVGTIATTNSNVIPSGQGFFVVATNASAHLSFNESAKINTQASAVNGNLFLGTPVQAAVNRYLRLQLAKDSINEDDIYIGFNQQAKTQYVFNEDAPYFTGNGQVSLSSMSSDHIPLAINRLPLPKQSEAIHLNVNARTSGPYSLNLTQMVAIPKLYDIWLMDAYKKDSLAIGINKSYAFNILKADTNTYGSNRFSLVIRQNPALGIHLLNFTAAKITAGAQLTWTTENEQNYTNFTVEKSTDDAAFNAVGGFLSTAEGTYSLQDKNQASAAARVDRYRLKIEDLNGTVSYSKVITLMYGTFTNSTAAKINVYPNPASSILNLSIQPAALSPDNQSALQTLNSTPGLPGGGAGSASYSIKIINITGSVITTATSAQPTWQANVSNLLPGTYIIQVLNNADKSFVGKSTFIKN